MQKHASGSNAASNANEIRLLISAIDKAAKRGIIHKNAANRRKARLNDLLKSGTAKPAGA
jgi:ribosomal protein S20